MDKRLVMRYMRLIGVFLLLTVVSFAVSAQGCRDFDKKCPPPPKDYKVSTLSKSFSLEKRKTVNIKLTLYGDRIYFFSVAGKSKLGKIHYRLLENLETSRVLYDNASAGYESSKMFEISSAINVVLEISAPNYHLENARECAALLVGYKPLK